MFHRLKQRAEILGAKGTCPLDLIDSVTQLACALNNITDHSELAMKKGFLFSPLNPNLEGLLHPEELNADYLENHCFFNSTVYIEVFSGIYWRVAFRSCCSPKTSNP